jgi:VWFA-related protein
MAFAGVAESQNPYAVSVDVNLVVLQVAVKDRSGSPVTGLKEEDFRVFEDGVPQEILQFDHEDTPVALGLVLDNSRSMRPKLPEVTNAAVALAQASNREDQLFVIHFSEDVTFGLPEGKSFTNSIVEVEGAVGQIPPAGKTALYDAVIAGLEHLRKSPLKRKVLVVVSDGGDNASRHTLGDAQRMAIASEALIYTIGIADELSEETKLATLKQLARETGGSSFLHVPAGMLTRVCRRIASDIRTQYTLGYVSSNRKKDGTFRAIRVTVKPVGPRRLRVRARAGYLAPKRPDSAGPGTQETAP